MFDVKTCIGWFAIADVTGEGAVFVVGVLVPPVPVVAPDVDGPDGSLIIGFNLIRAQIGLPCKSKSRCIVIINVHMKLVRNRNICIGQTSLP